VSKSRGWGWSTPSYVTPYSRTPQWPRDSCCSSARLSSKPGEFKKRIVHAGLTDNPDRSPITAKGPVWSPSNASAVHRYRAEGRNLAGTRPVPHLLNVVREKAVDI
jgi:hypothetical protein